jgi:hypothetical protein
MQQSSLEQYTHIAEATSSPRIYRSGRLLFPSDALFNGKVGQVYRDVTREKKLSGLTGKAMSGGACGRREEGDSSRLHLAEQSSGKHDIDIVADPDGDDRLCSINISTHSLPYLIRRL